MKRIALAVTALLLQLSSFGAVLPGTLSTILPDMITADSEALSLAGEADVRDLEVLRVTLPSAVKHLDLSQLRIVEYHSPLNSEFQGKSFPADHLPEWIFFNTDIETLVLPSNLKSIGKGALSASRLRKISIPVGVEVIDEYAFYNSMDLEQVDFPESLRTLGKSAFGNCQSLKSVNLAVTAVDYLPALCFAGCRNLNDISLPSSLHKIGSRTLRDSRISHLELSQVAEFEDYALYGLPYLTEISFYPAACFGKGVLMNDTALTSASGIPEVIPPLFAAGCNSLDINDIAKDALEVGAWALSGGKAQKLTLSAASFLDEGALAGISGLESIDVRALRGDIPHAESTTFADIDIAGIKLFVASDFESEWRVHPVWREFDIVPDYLMESSASSVATDNLDIKIRATGNALHISSSSPLSAISIYSFDGMLLLSAGIKGNQCDIELPTSSTPNIVVAVKTENGVKVRKISLNN